ncbi:MAG: alpha-1,2-fucosyltransferase [Dehalobacter sp.]|nr:alpha-1,2-fucosyltransferase [Dehalobacter sp.]
MKIVLLDGALANQTTQYIFARCLEEATGDKVYLDDLWFYLEHGDLAESVESQEHHSYQLHKYTGTKPTLLSSYFTPDVWEEIVSIARKKPPLLGGSHMPQILKDSGLEFFMIAECPTYIFDGMIARMPYYHHIPEMLQSQGNVYYWGYFTNGGWFMQYEDMFRKELALPPLESESDLEMSKKIEDSYAIAIHVRRGGYALLNRSLQPSYFKDAISKIMKKFNKKRDLRFFIFSDDIEHCKMNAKEYGFLLPQDRLVYCEEKRTSKNNHCDMQLMAMCDGMVLCSSVYGYLAALLNTKKDKWVINPIQSRGVF